MHIFVAVGSPGAPLSPYAHRTSEDAPEEKEIQHAMRPAVGHEDAPFPFPLAQSACTAPSVCEVSPVVSMQAPFKTHANCEPLVSLDPLLLHPDDSIAPNTRDARKNDWLTGDMSTEYGQVRTVSRCSWPTKFEATHRICER